MNGNDAVYAEGHQLHAAANLALIRPLFYLVSSKRESLITGLSVPTVGHHKHSTPIAWPLSRDARPVDATKRVVHGWLGNARWIIFQSSCKEFKNRVPFSPSHLNVPVLQHFEVEQPIKMKFSPVSSSAIKSI